MLVTDVDSVLDNLTSVWPDWKAPSLIAIFNGPRGSGKDTTAGLVQERLNKLCVAADSIGIESDYEMGRAVNITSELEKFAKCLKDGIAATFSLTPDERHYYFETDAKLHPQARFGGKIPYQVLIWYSEKCLKPYFGNYICAELFLQRSSSSNADVLLISDGGFDVEVDHVTSRVSEADRRVLLFRLVRDGKTFDGDSREYVYGKGKVAVDIDMYMPEAHLDPAGYDAKIDAMVDLIARAVGDYKNDVRTITTAPSIDELIENIESIKKDTL